MFLLDGNGEARVQPSQIISIRLQVPMASTVQDAVRPPPPGGVVAHAEAAAPLSDAAGPEGIPLAPLLADIAGGKLAEKIAKCEKAVAETSAREESTKRYDRITEHIRQAFGLVEEVSKDFSDDCHTGKRKACEAFGIPELDPKAFEAGVKRMKDEARSKREAAEIELKNAKEQLTAVADTALSVYVGSVKKVRQAAREYVPPKVIQDVTALFKGRKTYNQAVKDMMHSFLVALYVASTHPEDPRMKEACNVVERYIDLCHCGEQTEKDIMFDIFMEGNPYRGTSRDRLTPAVVSTAMILIDCAFADAVDDDSGFEAAWSSNQPDSTSLSSAGAMIGASHSRMDELVQRTREDTKKGKKPKFFWHGRWYPNLAGLASASLFPKCHYHLPIIITFALNEACEFVQ